MTLSAGTRVGPYEITAQIGAGGMGEVYRATDTNLKRAVAIKVLPEAVALDPARLLRFQREAEVLASLNHPNIAAIYGLERSDGATALVMELVEGPTLAERMALGAMPVDEALPIARQIASALEAAHEQGIVHRDLKPANVKVKPDGTVKVLDFGLAKALEPQLAMAQGDLSHSPTLTARATQMGVILGTAAYMAPEQARGKPVDRRADVWAFGVVLFEMLAGTRAFPGDDVSQTLARVIDREPPWEALPSTTAPAIMRLLRRCLRKDPRTRLRDIGDARLELEEAADPAAPEPAAKDIAPSPHWKRALPWAITVFAAVIAAAAATGVLRSRQERPPMGAAPAHLQIVLPAGLRLALDTAHPTLALSPDGTRLAFVAEDATRRRLYLRELAAREARAIEGTEGAASPFFSPDGDWIGFFAGGALMKVSSSSGAPLPVHTTTSTSVHRGAAWLDDRTVIHAASANSGLALGAVDGGKQRSIVEWSAVTDRSAAHSWPDPLPGGTRVLFTDHGDQATEAARVALLSLESREVRPLALSGTNPRYSSTGHLLYGRRGSLYAARFDAEREEITGSELRVLESVASDGNGSVQYAVGGNGTLAYVFAPHLVAEYELAWIDREGGTETLLESERPLAFPRLSPDGSQVVVTIVDGSNLDLWLFDLDRRALTRRLTSHPGEDFGAVWSPDGRQLAISSEVGGEHLGPALAVIEELGSPPRALTHTPAFGTWETAASWSPDGAWVVFVGTVAGPGDIMMLSPLEHDAQPRALVQTPAGERAPMISPDGRWLAYVSDETGRQQVYVGPFGRAGRRTPISTRGGTEPLWSRDGRELFYREGNRLMVSRVEGSTERFVGGEPEVVFDDLGLGHEWSEFGAQTANYDVARDASRFLLARRKNPVTATVIDVVLNWPQTLLASL
jgi:serine/threonine-protein kinase